MVNIVELIANITEQLHAHETALISLDATLQQQAALLQANKKVSLRIETVRNTPEVQERIQHSKDAIIAPTSGGWYFQASIGMPSKNGDYTVVVSCFGRETPRKLKYEVFAKQYPDLVQYLPKDKKSHRVMFVAHKSGKNRTVLTPDTERKFLQRLSHVEAQALEKETIEITKKLTQQRTEIQQQLEHCKTSAHQRDAHTRALDSLRTQQRFLAGCIPGLSARVEIGKKSYCLNGLNSFYSLWLGQSPIFQHKDESLCFLATTSHDSPFKVYTLDSFLSKEEVQWANHFLGLVSGKFCNDRAYVLEGSGEATARDLFDRVQEGIRVLPKPLVSTSSRGSAGGGTDERMIQYRTWGQEYIYTRQPDRVVEGEVLGSGGAYKLFVFEGLGIAVVEFDQLDRATYIFRVQYADNLRVRARSEILRERPEGFVTRIVHNDRARWQQLVDSVLR